MVDVFKEKEALTNALSDQYAKSLISMDEFESMIDQVNKVESLKQLNAVKKSISENTGLMLSEDKNEQKNTAVTTGKEKKSWNETVFSSRSITAQPIDGHAGKFSCVFGANKIKIEDLPPGKTTLKLETVFGSTEILVPKYVKIVNNVTAIFAGVFTPSDKEEIDYESSLYGAPELHIKGEVVFGNVTIKKAE